MTVRRRSRIWTQQPQVPVSVSQKFGKPAAAAIHTSIAAPDLVSGRAATLYGGTNLSELVGGPVGKGVRSIAGGNAIVPSYAIPEITGDYTLICVASIPSSGTWTLIDTDTYPSTRHLQFRVESSNQVGAIPFDTGGNPVFPVSAGSVSHGVPFVAAVRLSGSDCDVWLGGTGGTKATMSGSPQHAHGLFSIGGSQSGNFDDCVNGGATIYSWVAFPSAISDAALRELTKSVSAYWQIFAPRSSRRLISAGGGSVNANASGALSALSVAAPTASASGSAFATGALAAITISAPTATASAGGSAAASGSFAALSITPATATATATTSATASGSFATISLSAPTATATGTTAGGANATCTPAQITISHAAAIAIGSAVASGGYQSIGITAPTGSASVGNGNATASGAWAAISITAPTAYASSGFIRAPAGSGPTVIQPGSYRPSNTGGRRY